MEKQRILFVNSSENEKIEFENSVRGIGYEVDYAPTGILALSLLKKHAYRVMILTYQVEGIDSGSLIQKAKQINTEIITILITVNFSKADINFYYNKCNVDGVVFYPVDYDCTLVPLLNELITSQILSNIEIEDNVKKIEEKKKRKDMIASVVKVLNTMDIKWNDTRKLATSLWDISIRNIDGNISPDGLMISTFEKNLIDTFRNQFSDAEAVTFDYQIDFLKKIHDDGNNTIKFRLDSSCKSNYENDYFLMGFLLHHILWLYQDILDIHSVTCDISGASDNHIEVFLSAEYEAELYNKKRHCSMGEAAYEFVDYLLFQFATKHLITEDGTLQYHLLIDVQ